MYFSGTVIVKPFLKIDKMKKTLILLLLLIGSVTAQSQELTWHTNLDKAMAISKKSKKPLLMFFTGSDWCGWCIKLQKEVLKTPEFEAWAKENVVLVEVDYPRRTAQEEAIKVQNAQLQQSFQIRGYPTVWFVNATKKDNQVNFEKLGSTSYVPGGPAAWLAGANKILKKT